MKNHVTMENILEEINQALNDKKNLDYYITLNNDLESKPKATPLLFAVAINDYELIKKILDNGATIDFGAEEGKLIGVVIRGHLRRIREMISMEKLTCILNVANKIPQSQHTKTLYSKNKVKINTQTINILNLLFEHGALINKDFLANIFNGDLNKYNPLRDKNDIQEIKWIFDWLIERGACPKLALNEIEKHDFYKEHKDLFLEYVAKSLSKTIQKEVADFVSEKDNKIKLNKL